MNTLSPTTRLFNTLLVTLLAIMLGLVCVRLKVVQPEAGHTKAMAFFTGQIAFPLLIFNTVATAELGSMDMGVIGACTFGKASVMLLTFLLTFFGYKPDRSTGQRILTSSVFAFYAVASNDFAVGFPVIEALYGKTVDMGVYIAGNSLVGSFLFVPLTVVFFAIGGALRGEGGGPRSLGKLEVLRATLKDLATNPVLVMTVLGLAYKTFLPGTLIQEAGTTKLPHPLCDGIELVTGPFNMCALFLTGASLRSARVQLWPCILVLMKVVVCAYVSFAFGSVLIADHGSLTSTLENFTFFYGAIPSSSAPMIFASQFDPGATEEIAIAVLFGMILAGPIMFLTAVFLSDTSNMDYLLGSVQASVDAISLVCGIFFFMALLILNRRWGFHCPVKQLIAWYAVTVTLYSAVSLGFNPQLDAQGCDRYNQDGLWSPMMLLHAWLQNSAALLLLMLHFFYARGTSRSSKKPILGVALAAVCFVLAILPSVLAAPNTINEICGHQPMESELYGNLLWSCLKLLDVMALVVLRVSCAGLQESKAADTSYAIEESCSPTDEFQSDPEAQRFVQSQNSMNWHNLVPRKILVTLAMLNIAKILTQVINAAQVLFLHQRDRGSFAAMLTLEAIMEHGQMLILFLTLFFQPVFTSWIVDHVPGICPLLLTASANEMRGDEENVGLPSVKSFSVGQFAFPTDPETETLDLSS